MKVLIYLMVSICHGEKHRWCLCNFYIKHTDTDTVETKQEFFTNIVDIGLYMKKNNIVTDYDELCGKISVFHKLGYYASDDQDVGEFTIIIRKQMTYISIASLLALCMYSTEEETKEWFSLLDDCMLYPLPTLEDCIGDFSPPPYTDFDFAPFGLYVRNRADGFKYSVHFRNWYAKEERDWFFDVFGEFYDEDGLEYVQGLQKLILDVTRHDQHVHYIDCGLHGYVERLNQSATFQYIAENIPEYQVVQQILTLAM